MKKLFLFLVCLLPVAAIAQESSSEPKKTYWTSASELIFSWGMVEDNDLPEDPSSVMRFSVFFHFQEQMHVDFNNNTGMFIGLGVRNVGMINDLGNGLKLKQRSYSFGIPIAFKFGNFEDNFYAALGAEAELMFHYKQKAFYDDSKYKKSEWFSDRTNIINPSVFLDLNFRKGTYVRFKYYLLDFLVEDKQSLSIDGVSIPYSPEKSQLFYVALGLNINHKDIKKQVQSTEGTYSYR